MSSFERLKTGLGLVSYLGSMAILTGVVACAGEVGPAGPAGPIGGTGSGCTAVDNSDGSYTVTCGTDVVTMSDGAGCTVVDNTDGSKTLTCGSTTATISNGVDAPIPVVPSEVTATVDSFSVAGGVATMDFTVLDAAGNPMPGLAVPGSNATRLQYFRLAYAQLSPGASATDPNMWIGLSTGDRAPAELTDNGDGTYTYVSTRDISATYDPVLSTRVLLLVALGPAVLNTYNAFADFPGTGATVTRDVVPNTACVSCHGRLERQNFPMHGGGSRYDARACVVCHVSTLGGGEAYFPTMVHKIHSAQSFGLGDYSSLTFPQAVNNCATCHQGTDEYWTTMPSRTACSSCHTSITWDGSVYTGINGIVDAGQTHNDPAPSACINCHGPGGFADIAVVHKLPANNDPAQRTISASITGVVINDGEAGETNDGTVVVSFTMENAGTPVVDPLEFKNLEFVLSKLVPGTLGAGSHWQAYVNKFRTKNTDPEVAQGYSESSASGTLVNVGGGAWTYTFGLLEADIPGDIRTINNARDNVLGYTLLWPHTVSYEPALTHRVAMMFRDANNVNNATNPVFDFVPLADPAAPAITRDLVNVDKCRNCHAGTRLHKGYEVKLCVNCHNQGTFDPFSGAAPVTVDLQRIVHKIHMGRNLPSVLAGGTFLVNGANFGTTSFPQSPAKCLVCHDESLSEGMNWQEKPTSRACGTCHDSETAKLHISQNSIGGDACVVCHGVGRVAPVKEAHYGVMP